MKKMPSFIPLIVIDGNYGYTFAAVKKILHDGKMV